MFTRKFALISLEILTGLVLVMGIAALPDRPEDVWFRLDLIAYLILFLTAFALTFINFPHLWQPRNIVVSGLMIAGLLLGIAAVQPYEQSHANAAQRTVSRQQAIDYGSRLAQEVKKERKTESMARKEIDSRYKNQDLRYLANQGFVAKLRNQDRNLNPKVPVVKYGWRCNQNGCSYADRTSVWTISHTTRMIATVLGLLAVGSLVWVTYQPNKNERN